MYSDGGLRLRPRHKVGTSADEEGDYMKDISLKELLEAGCHFGHREERWHPKANKFIYQPREGIHIIDLVKTRDGLEKAGAYIKELAAGGKVILYCATKRQAKGVVTEAAKRAGVAYLTTRWIGGFITNWEEVKKNIDKMNKMRVEKTDGSWQKFPKHEQIKLAKHLKKLEVVYGGVADLKGIPDALFIVDIRKEIACVREAGRCGVTTIAIVDTNSDPTPIDHYIPANDDAVGSIQLVVNFLTDAYLEGRKIAEKKEGRQEKAASAVETQQAEKQVKAEKIEKGEKKETAKPKKTGRPKKISTN